MSTGPQSGWTFPKSGVTWADSSLPTKKSARLETIYQSAVPTGQSHVNAWASNTWNFTWSLRPELTKMEQISLTLNKILASLGNIKI